MGGVAGVLGSVTWTGDDPQSTVAAAIQFQRFTLNDARENFDEPIFGSAHPNTVGGLGDWSGTIEGILATPNLGNEGLVTYATGYTTNAHEWEITLDIDTFDTTVFNATAPTVKTYSVGRYRWSGSYSCYVGAVTNPTKLPIAAEPASIQLRYDDNTADGIFGGTIISRNSDMTVDPRAVNLVRIPFDGDGALSSTGTAPLLPTGAFAVGSSSKLVLAQYTNQALSGNAYMNRLTLRCRVNEPIRVTVGFRGTGVGVWA